MKPRHLDYGTYKITFNASMFQNDGPQVKETSSKAVGYFLIQKCDLIAEIVGGTGKAVAVSGMLQILLVLATL